MNPLGLSPEALDQRRRYVQAGDAAKIMAGEWRQVWREKMGLAAGDDLSDVLAVQMGSFTEPFNLAWCEKQTGRAVEYFSDNRLALAAWELLHRPSPGRETRRIVANPELCVSDRYPWMACNLDGLTTTARGERCVIDAKHVGRADDPMIVRYTAAGTHQATVMGTDWWALSVFVGNSKWELIEQEVDPLYQAELIAATREFWGYVERGEEPEDRTPPGLPPKPAPKLRSIVIPTDDPTVFEALSRSNNWLSAWCTEATRFAGTQAAATVNNIAKAHMKDLVPEDVGTVEWGLIKQARDKAGSVRINLRKGEGDAGE